MAVTIKIVKIIRVIGTILLETWGKIKKFFGFSDYKGCGGCKDSCTEEKEEKIKIKIKKEDLQGIQEPPYIYKLEPRPKEEEKEEKEELEPTSFASSNTKRKPKRSWYNNGEKQQLVTSEEASKLPKTWKKGKLPKTPKTPKTPKKDK